MAYSDGEALLLTRVQACTGFDSNNTSRSNWRILNSGKSNQYAILRPAEFDIEWTALAAYTVTWNTIIEVWQRYTNETDTPTNLYTHIANLMPILTYPYLGDSSKVLDSSIVGAAEPEEMWTAGGGVAWLRWAARVEWKENIEVTYAE
jgi:hypothetical protein